MINSNGTTIELLMTPYIVRLLIWQDRLLDSL